MAKRRAKGEGGITKRKDGRYQGEITLQGKRRTMYGKTRQEVSQKLAEARKQEAQGVRLGTERVTLGAWLTQWLATKRRKWKENTYIFHETAIRLHITPQIGHIPLIRLTVLDVQRWLTQLQDERGEKRAVTALFILRAGIEGAVRAELVARNVAKLVETPRATWRRGKALTHGQTAKLLATVQGDRYEAAYHIAVTLGLRIGELCSLKWADIDFEAATLTVQKGKTAAARRTLPLTPELVARLRQHWQRQQGERQTAAWRECGAVFATHSGGHIHTESLRTNFKRRLQWARLPDFRFHDLRHTALTRLAAAGMPPAVVQAIAGQSDPSIALAVYTHIDTEAMREAMAAHSLSNRLSNGQNEISAGTE